MGSTLVCFVVAGQCDVKFAKFEIILMNYCKLYVCICMYMYVYVCICMYMYVYMYVYIYTSYDMLIV
jgi:hypothetical protein